MKYFVVYQDVHNYKALVVKECKTHNEVEDFMIDIKEEICPEGERVMYVIFNTDSALLKGSIDRT